MVDKQTPGARALNPQRVLRWLPLAMGWLALGCFDAREPDGAGDNPCATCHGSPARDASELVQSAPPIDTEGNTDVATASVGAHQAHLTGGSFSAPVECSACHVVPDVTEAPGHIDEDEGAEVIFGGIATHEGATPAYDASTLTCSGAYCHNPTDPSASMTLAWNNESATLTCISCHGFPPPEPHPQVTDCSQCHAGVVGPNGAIINRSLHVDGELNLEGGDGEQDCGGCHGTAESPAPPPDLAGNTESPAVGAHEAHLSGSATARAVQCSECHVVPDQTFAEGHLGEPPADLTFSGVAVKSGADPEYDGNSCANTYCHSSIPGGENPSPEWTDGPSVATCTSCHGYPPPPPHINSKLCSLCHQNVTDDDTFIDPSQHVDGTVDF